MNDNSQFKILIADDEASITSGLSELLNLEGYETTAVDDGKKAFDLLQEQSFNLVLVDLMIPGLNGLQVLEKVKKKKLMTEVIIITGQGSISTAVDAMKAGAYDYLTKPVKPHRLRTIIPKALEHQSLVLANKKLEETIKRLTHYEDMVGQAEKMQEIYKFIDAVADTTASVLITGESGTGKELVARAIHNKSSRARGPFTAVNCSAFPREILENELFGHEKGAFTGALNEKAGCFEMSNTGTLFLDEIGEMPADTQAKILRALEEHRFRRLGGTKEITVDVRVIAATNRDIQKALNDGTLRDDLYYRLSVMEMELPPLRERMSDLLHLINEFLKQYNQRYNKNIKKFSADCLEILRKYKWPGNVRELKNMVERAVILCTENTIQIKHLPQNIFRPKSREGSDAESVIIGKTLHEIEKEVIFKTLKITKNNKTQAAQLLGISLKTMHNKLNKFYLENEIE